MSAMDVIANVELCDRHAVEMLVNFLELEEAKKGLCRTINEGGMLESFRQFVEVNLDESDDEDDSFGNGLSEEDRKFLRELEAFANDDPHVDHDCEEMDAEEFVADEFDLAQLAAAYLQEAMSLFCFSFFTGNDEERRALFLMNRFERVASHLTENQRWAIVEEVDRQRSATTGDTWQVFKYTCRPEFWRTPADFDAVVRVAESVPEEMTPDQEEQYGPQFLETLREVRRMSRSEAVPDWQSDGF